jgi:hypothetical protein
MCDTKCRYLDGLLYERLVECDQRDQATEVEQSRFRSVPQERLIVACVHISRYGTAFSLFSLFGCGVSLPFDASIAGTFWHVVTDLTTVTRPQQQ